MDIAANISQPPTPLQRMAGSLTIDQRSESEAVMVIWLMPGEETELAPVLAGAVIIGTVHLRKAGNGVTFELDSAPVLTGPDGVHAPLVVPSPEVQQVLERLRKRLKERGSGMQALGPFAEQLSLHIFETGDVPFGPGWSVAYAQAQYPLSAAG